MTGSDLPWVEVRDGNPVVSLAGLLARLLDVLEAGS